MTTLQNIGHFLSKVYIFRKIIAYIVSVAFIVGFIQIYIASNNTYKMVLSNREILVENKELSIQNLQLLKNHQEILKNLQAFKAALAKNQETLLQNHEMLLESRKRSR